MLEDTEIILLDIRHYQELLKTGSTGETTQ